MTTTTTIALRTPRNKRTSLLRALLHDPRALTGGSMLLLAVIAATVGPMLSPYGATATDVDTGLAAPDAAHWFGTDSFGRDVLTRLLTGLGYSLVIGASVALAAALLGVTIGLIAAYYSKTDTLLMRICDGFLAFPDILLALAVVAALGPSLPNLIACITVVFVPQMARLVRSTALVSKELPYVEALKSVGAGGPRIIIKHILPNSASTILAQISIFFAVAIVIETALSFLGAGIPAPTPSIGNMIADGKLYVYSGWWMIAFPAAALAWGVLAVTLLGDALRDQVDPTTRTSGRGGIAAVFAAGARLFARNGDSRAQR